MENIIYNELITKYTKGNNIIIMSEAKTLKEAIENKSLPKYNRKLTKKTVALLEVIARNFPKEVPINRLANVKGSDLLEDGATNIGEAEINPEEEYTVMETVVTKVNHLKRLKEAWEMSNSPLHIIFYGFKFIGNEYKNEWIEVINDSFNTSYPPAYLEDADETEDWDA